jgi:hypothetical protein
VRQAVIGRASDLSRCGGPCRDRLADFPGRFPPAGNPVSQQLQTGQHHYKEAGSHTDPDPGLQRGSSQTGVESHDHKESFKDIERRGGPPGIGAIALVVRLPVRDPRIGQTPADYSAEAECDPTAARRSRERKPSRDADDTACPQQERQAGREQQEAKDIRDSRAGDRAKIAPLRQALGVPLLPGVDCGDREVGRKDQDKQGGGAPKIETWLKWSRASSMRCFL